MDMNQLESMIFANLYAQSICDGVGANRAMADANSAIRRMREAALDRARRGADLAEHCADADKDIVESMIAARARLAGGRAISVRWCLYPQQAKALRDVEAIRSYDGKELFRGEEVVVYRGGGYVFNVDTGERQSIKGEM
jgi:hypothetical protein